MTATTAPGAARGWLVAVALACAAAVGAALWAQHVHDMRPCPWCILQRLLFIVIAVLALIAAALRAGPRAVLAALVALVAAAGVAAAAWQHAVAAKQSSCAMTFADQVLGALGVERLWPAMFQVTASCAEAAAPFGVPFEYWSLALFALVGAAALRAAWLSRRAASAPRAAPMRNAVR